MFMGIISWIIIGALAGWIASMLTGNDRKMGAWANICTGIAGGLIGGFLIGIFGGTGVTGFNIWSLFVSILGSVVLLSIANSISRRK